jgi:putative oxidoreductase
MDYLARYRPQILSVARIAITLVLLEVPSAKFLGIPHVTKFDHLTPLSWPGGIAGIIEGVFGLLLLVGLFSRFAAFILSGEMAAAYFFGHAPHGFYPLVNHGETAVVWCFSFLYFAAAGGGPWALDALFRRPSSTAPLSADARV